MIGAARLAFEEAPYRRIHPVQPEIRAHLILGWNRRAAAKSTLGGHANRAMELTTSPSPSARTKSNRSSLAVAPDQVMDRREQEFDVFIMIITL
jgi:hypothetical protein